MQYVKINPSGNITALVTDEVSRVQQKEVAMRLMRMDPEIEQVGFLEKPALPGAAARLQMMGGEFCGNATMSAAAWLASQAGMDEGRAAVYAMEVSGAADIVPCRITNCGGRYTGTVPMPLPWAFMQAEILPGICVPRICFDGIDHLIVPDGVISGNQAETIIPELCRRFGSDALGMVFTKADFSAIRPLVYVQGTGSSVWENSCGSGTAALGAYAAMRADESVCLDVVQPGGRIRVEADCCRGVLQRIEICGNVEMMSAGEIPAD